MHAFRTAHAARDAKTKLDLRDEEGERIIATPFAKRGAITEPMLRWRSAIDLGAWAAIALESTVDLSEHDFVRRSVLNFARSDIAHRSIDEAGVSDIRPRSGPL